MIDDGFGLLGDDVEQAVALLRAGRAPREIARLLKVSEENLAANLPAIRRAALDPQD